MDELYRGWEKEQVCGYRDWLSAWFEVAAIEVDCERVWGEAAKIAAGA